MTDTEKLARLKILIGIDDDSEDTLLSEYLAINEERIYSKMYRVSGYPDELEVPQKYESIQIEASMIDYFIQGAENEERHDENSISRTFKYSSGLELIEARVISVVG